MDLKLSGKIALVAGASQGIGRAIARSLADEGVNVVLCARGQATLEQTAREIRDDFGVKALPVVCDVTDVAALEALVSAAQDEFGRIDILVNNAGGPPGGDLMSLEDEAWLNGFNLNLMSAIRLSRLVIPGMKSQGAGVIINITSISVKQPIDGLIISNSIRAGVIGMAKTLSREIGDAGIRVLNVLPGYTMTERLKELMPKLADRAGLAPAEMQAKIEAEVPLGRLGHPDEIADVVAFLASDRASYVSGVSLQVDGGLVRSIL